MGYYAYVSDFVLRFTDEKRAVKAANDLGYEGDTLAEVFYSASYEDFEMDSNGIVSSLHFQTKYRDEESLWTALTPYIVAPKGWDHAPYIEWTGEDSERWRFVFEDGRMSEVGCDVVWPYIGQTSTAPANVEPLTMEHGAKATLTEAIEQYIEDIEAAHGMGDPAISDHLIREAKMTLKSIKDAQKVILNIEAVQ